MAEKVEILDIDGSGVIKTLNQMKEELKNLKKQFDTTDVSSAEFRDLLAEITKKQQELTNITKSGIAAQKGSYNELVNTMATLKQQWRATNDEAERATLGEQIKEINTQLKELDATVGNHQRNVGDYKGQIKLLREELAGLEKGTDEYNAKMQELSNTMRDYKDQQADIANGAQDFGQVVGNTAKLTAGFTGALQIGMGAMQLFGVDAENATKMIAKLQSVMAITQGLGAIDNAVKAYKRLNAAIAASETVQKLFNKTKVVEVAETTAATTAKGAETVATGALTKAQLAFNAAVAANPLGAFLTLVAGLIAAISLLSNAFDESSEATARFRTELESINTIVGLIEAKVSQASYDFKENMALRQREYDLMVAQGKSEEELHNKRLELLGREAGYHLKLANYYKSEVELVRNESDGMIGLNATIEDAATAIAHLDEQVRFWQERVDGYESDVVRAEIEADIQTYKNQIDIWKQYTTAMQNWQNEDIAIKDNANKQRIETLKYQADIAKKEKEAAEKAKQRAKELAKIKSDLNKKLRDDEVDRMEESAEKEKLIAQFKYDDEIEKYQKMLKDKEIKQQDYNAIAASLELDLQKEILDIDKKYTKKANDDRLKQYKATNDKMLKEIDAASKQREISINKKYLETGDEKRYNASIRELDMDVVNDKISQTQVYINNLNAELSNLDESSEEYKNVTEEIANATNSMLDLQLTKTNLEIESTRVLTEVEEERWNVAMEGVVAVNQALAEFGNSMEGVYGVVGKELADMMTQMSNVAQSVKDGQKGWQTYARIASVALNGVGTMLQGIADEQDETTEEGFKKKKAFEISAATMNMIAGIVGAVAGIPSYIEMFAALGIGAPAAGIALGSTLATIVGALGAANIANIAKQSMDGSSSGASGSVSQSALASIQAPVEYTTDVQGASTETEQSDTRVYVLESDITSTQNKVHISENEATF